MKHHDEFLKIVNEAKAHIKEISTTDVKNLLDKKEKFILVDVREDHEWSDGHLPEALHLGKGVIERDIEHAIPDKNSKIVLYCGGGFRSALAVDSIQKMGYHNAFSMDGGFREWLENKYPIQK